MNNLGEAFGKETFKAETCACKVSDCFACKDGGCAALTDNDFGERSCPFFKTSEQVEKERAAAKIRMLALVGAEV